MLVTDCYWCGILIAGADISVHSVQQTGTGALSSCTKDDQILVAGINVRVMTSAMAVVILSTDLSLACFIEVNP